MEKICQFLRLTDKFVGRFKANGEPLWNPLVSTVCEPHSSLSLSCCGKLWGEGVGDIVKIQNFKNEKIQRDFFVCGTQSRFWLWLTLRNIHFRWN